AASQPVCDWLRSTARSFVFSTGVSPRLARQVSVALDHLGGEAGDRRRERLGRNCEALQRALFGHLSTPNHEINNDALGPVLARGTPHIVPLLVGGNERALALSAALRDDGFHVQAIRPPTVPQGRARLRLTLSAGHSLDEIDAVAHCLHHHFSAAGLPLVSPKAA